MQIHSYYISSCRRLLVFLLLCILFKGKEVSSWQSHVSTHPVASSALRKVLEEASLIDNNPSSFEESNNNYLTFLFVGQSHADEFEALVKDAHESLDQNNHNLVAILGGGVIGERVELDQPGQPGLSILTGSLPKGANVEFLKGTEELLLSSDNDDGSSSSYLLLADPFSKELESIMSEISSSLSNAQISGGITCPISAAQSSIALNDRILETGTVLGVKFTGTVGFQTLVAQGCRPIFDTPFTITQVINGNVISQLDNRPATKVLHELLTTNKEEAEQISQNGGLLCGISSPFREEDYLCRQVMGFAPEVGGIVIGANDIKEGDNFVFQMRDKDTAEKDMELMVNRAKTERLFAGKENKGKPLAAIQISCVGRGRGLFGGIPNMDITQILDLIEDTNSDNPPVAGFYANGEIGPVGLSGFTTGNDSSPSCHLHGFTTVATILCDYGSSSQNDNIVPDEEGEEAWG
mmetsp:Transcript_37671/g.43032  ORF Transcript_37671/g.43032 Transcript_37671/m.43032 type:complete len:466 (-) Transcript_37671:48-1445(-)